MAMETVRNARGGEGPKEALVFAMVSAVGTAQRQQHSARAVKQPEASRVLRAVCASASDAPRGVHFSQGV